MEYSLEQVYAYIHVYLIESAVQSLSLFYFILLVQNWLIKVSLYLPVARPINYEKTMLLHGSFLTIWYITNYTCIYIPYYLVILPCSLIALVS